MPAPVNATTDSASRNLEINREETMSISNFSLSVADLIPDFTAESFPTSANVPL
jgi:hypothetical protein